MTVDRRSFLVQLCSGVASFAGTSAVTGAAARGAMELRIRNPYEHLRDDATWLVGEVHAHVDRSPTAPRRYDYGDDAGAIYAAAKEDNLDFVGLAVEVTEANGGADAFGDIKAENTHGVIGIAAREIQNNLYSSQRYFAESGAEFLHVLTLGEGDTGISICAHPRFYDMAGDESGAWSRMKAALLSPIKAGPLEVLRVRGVEIFNGHTLATLREQGRQELYRNYDEACWDEMLMAGMLCWGFAANDAFVKPNGYERFSPLGRVHVAVQERNAAAVLAALRQGRFYSSTGVRVAAPRVQSGEGGELRLRVRAEEPVHWVANVHRVRNGAALTTRDAGPALEATFEIEPDWAYVRVQCTSATDPWRRAWLQPLINAETFGARA